MSKKCEIIEYVTPWGTVEYNVWVETNVAGVMCLQRTFKSLEEAQAYVRSRNLSLLHIYLNTTKEVI